jgi:hypothetical protein
MWRFGAVWYIRNCGTVTSYDVSIIKAHEREVFQIEWYTTYDSPCTRVVMSVIYDLIEHDYVVILVFTFSLDCFIWLLKKSH